MASLLLNRRDLDFLLYEWLDVELLTKRARFAEHSRETFDAVLDLAERIATEHFAPHNRKADENEPRMVDGKVVLVPEVGRALEVFGSAGLMAGTFLAEYGRTSKIADVIRFLNDVLLSAPSILIGLFVYTLMVRPMGTYSGWAGAVALAIIATPVIVRTTEDMLRLVPGPMREAGAALGAPRSLVIRAVTWRAASAGIVTGIILALARIAGETAPLLFTALNNNSWFNANLLGGVPNLPVMIYQFALSPYPNWQSLAWSGALLITVTILALSVVARFVIKDQRAR